MRARWATVAVTSAALLAGGAAGANSNGSQSGRTMQGCSSGGTCHAMNPGASATIQGPMTLTPGQRATYTLIITSTRPDFMRAGFDIAAAGGALMPAAGQAATRMVNGEMTHMMPHDRSGADVRVRFDVVAPATGNVMITAAGNAVDGNRNAMNDAWAITALAVAVSGGATDGGTPPPPVDAGAADAGTSADAGPRTERYDPSGSMAYGKCSVGHARGGGSAAAWAVVALAGVALARRRR